MSSFDTIAAIATAPGEAAIGVIRVSGPSALAIAEAIFHAAGGRSVRGLAPHSVHLGEVRDPVSGEGVDQVLVTPFVAPHSYTGEDVVEISGHGGPVPLRRILSLVLAQGARLANPGEFTCRAFLNGKLDLAQAEAVMDVVSARTDRSLGIAVRQLEGRLSGLVRGARDAILPLVAHIEATIDFPEDVPEMERADIRAQVDAALDAVSDLLVSARAGRIYRDGARVVIAGRPNVGKSSLLNALLREERAIVTEIPGTTRDVIEGSANIRGIPIRAIDTAGIREAGDPIEAIGVQRTLDQLRGADLVLAVLDASEGLSDADRQVLCLAQGSPCLVVANKSDLPERLDTGEVSRVLRGATVIRISATEGTGIGELEERIAVTVLGGTAGGGEGTLVTNVRHQAALERARSALLRARETLDQELPLELATIDLHEALGALGEITGESVSEAILTDIFDRFCIGK